MQFVSFLDVYWYGCEVLKLLVSREVSWLMIGDLWSENKVRDKFNDLWRRGQLIRGNGFGISVD